MPTWHPVATPKYSPTLSVCLVYPLTMSGVLARLLPGLLFLATRASLRTPFDAFKSFRRESMRTMVQFPRFRFVAASQPVHVGRFLATMLAASWLNRYWYQTLQL